MRPRRRIAAVAALLLHRACALQTAGHALGRQAPVDFLGARPAPLVQCGDGPLQGRSLGRESIAEHMDGRAVPGAGQLDTVDQLDAQPLGRAPRLGQAVEGVVIGHGQHAHAPLMRPRHQIGRRQHAVGSGSVAMQVYVHGR
ncbi:hypothetical protein D3C78_1224960 [compost metagenome]